jgi:hypothetical protein
MHYISSIHIVNRETHDWSIHSVTGLYTAFDTQVKSPDIFLPPGKKVYDYSDNGFVQIRQTCLIT